MVDLSKVKVNLVVSFPTKKKKASTKVTRVCKYCGKEFQVPSWYGAGKYCSKDCEAADKRVIHTPNITCEVCGKKLYMPPSRIKRTKHHTCSRECRAKLQSMLYSGDKNPNYGNRAERCKMVNNGKLYYKVHLDSHPFGRKTTGSIGVYYPEHRFVIEQNYERFDSKYFVEIDGKHYLKPDVDVHHLNEDSTDNRIENLIPLTRSEHTHLHNKQKEIIRDELGKIIGVVKHGELLGNHGNDNQQPSVNSNINEGSTTSNRIQTDNAEDSNVATSAVPNKVSEDIV